MDRLDQQFPHFAFRKRQSKQCDLAADFEENWISEILGFQVGVLAHSDRPSARYQPIRSDPLFTVLLAPVDQPPAVAIEDSADGVAATICSFVAFAACAVACVAFAKASRLDARKAAFAFQGLSGGVGIHLFDSFLKTKGLSFYINHKSIRFSKGIVLFAYPCNCSVMTPAQCRAARGLKNWTQGELAKAAGVSDVTIRNFENEKTKLKPASQQVIRTTLEAAGIEFFNGTGVKLRNV